MGDMEHKILNYIEHLWPYISGFFLVMVATFKLWLYERKKVKQRILTLEKLAENAATKDDLKDCSNEKDRQHHEGIKDVLIKLDKNMEEHGEILEKMNDQHAETLNTIIDLYKSDSK